MPTTDDSPKGALVRAGMPAADADVVASMMFSSAAQAAALTSTLATPLVTSGSVAAATATAWTPTLAAPRLWYRAEDALNLAGAAAQPGDAVYNIPNRAGTVSRTTGNAMPLVPVGQNLAAGSAANAPVLGNPFVNMSGYSPVRFGAVVSGGNDDRMATPLGALSTNGPFRIFAVMSCRGAAFQNPVSVSGTAGNSIMSCNASRAIRLGTDAVLVGVTFTDNTPFLMSIERAGTESLFEAAVSTTNLFGRVNGVKTTVQGTAATPPASADIALVLGNAAGNDAAGVDCDFWEVLVFEGKLTQADTWRVEGYLAQKYGRQTDLPGDHPYRGAAPVALAGQTAGADFEVSAYNWGYRQQVQGYHFELQGDYIGPSDGNQGSDYSRALPYDLKPGERRRMALLFNGSYSLRLALGLYYRGVRSTNGTSGLQDGIGPRLPDQRKHLYDFIQTAGMAGIAPEYWSPAPHWKTSSNVTGSTATGFAGGTLWAGGANARTVTLDSIRGSDPTGYAAQISAFTDAILADLEDLHSHPKYPMRVVAFGLQNEPLGVDAVYGSCLYPVGGTLYVDVLKSLIPKIRNSTKLSSWGGNPNTVDIHATSWGGPSDGIGTAIVADATALSTGKTVLQELAYWTYHSIGAQNTDANITLTSTGNSSTSGGQPYYAYRITATNPNGTPVAGNEYEFFNSLSRPAQFANLVMTWLNNMNFMRAPLITLIHAGKPSTDPTADRYALTSWRVPGDNGAPVDYASGIDYGEFAINDVNYNAAKPFIQWLKGAQYLLVQERVYSATKRVGAFFDSTGRLIVIALNSGTSTAPMTIAIGPQARTMRALTYSATARDAFADGGSQRTNVLTDTVPAQTMRVWVEAL